MVFELRRVVGGQFHPAVVKFGLQMHRGLLRGSTTRVFGLLHTLSQVLRDYEAPAGKELIRDFDATVLKPSLEFLHRCRPLSLSMRNTVEVFRQTLFGMENTQGDNEVKLKMLEHIADSTEFIRLAREQIKLTAAARIVDEDVVLIYGYCALVTSIVKYAKEHLKKEFKVIVVDTGPDFEGKLSLEELCCAGIQACYTYITALNVVMSKVNKVILGADAILANGAVKGPIGASQVAMVANSRNVPVLVCCETFKFTETVQTDSFHFNELGPESELLNLTENLNLNPGSTSAQIKTLNLKYDVMPGDFVSALVTEIGMLPCSSVPVVTREHFLRRA
ncbi:unnamed protein product [Notodromas monacha]|uniref:Translation initiation factor eIF2B subunit delta n=1 Tax=Notodromas monacha TaxID=399045 RepID=A0A7R9GJ43_9CRUS|nr:unnamed protein product [Notodromas monacha]CAG0922477.1 unnamed protein product [Notodromas monacha]